MRIGIEVLGTQSASRHRGVGRYVHEFVSTLLRVDRSREYVIYAQKDAPTDFLPATPDEVPLRFLEPDRARGERDMTAAFRRAMAANADGLDALLVTNPLELRDDFLTPVRPLNGLKIASIVYDLIPLIFRDHYYNAWPGPEFARRYHRGLDQLRTYDLLLAISEASRVDAVRLLGVPEGRVRNIMTASDSPCWAPGGPEPGASEREVLAGLGIKGPFVFSMGAMEYRKNIWGLMDAFARLPKPIRTARKLVVTYGMNAGEEKAVRAYAADKGISSQLIITPRLDDEELATLYRRCEVFVFPSLYEGFGLPVLEALRCGAPVVTGRNSSLVEVVGDAGILVDVSDSHEIEAAVLSVLESPPLANDLRRKGIAQGDKFGWETTARKAMEAFDGLAASARPKLRFDSPRVRAKPKPRIAFFSPLPPLLSGISDYSERLVEELRRDYLIDLYHDAGYEPHLKLRSLDFSCHDHRLFQRHDQILNYHAVVYQMGNSPFHKFVYDAMKTRPGVVTLHDFNLAGFRFWDAMSHGAGIEAFRRDLEDYDPDIASKLSSSLPDWADDPGRVVGGCAEAGAYLNQTVFRHATSVVVHSPWCVREARSVHRAMADKIVVVPHGATSITRSAREIEAIRQRHGLPADALVVGSFGIIHPTKMNIESIQAFSALAKRRDDAVLVLVGPESDQGAARLECERLGLSARVRFLGPIPTREFDELSSAVDIGLNLRRPPTNGETSGTLLNFLRQGVATIVTDVGTFADYPDSIVVKLPWDREDPEGLTVALLSLAEDAARRRTLGESARDYVAQHHEWAGVARRYAEIIEESRLRPTSSDSASSSILLGPHRRASAKSPRPEGGHRK